MHQLIAARQPNGNRRSLVQIGEKRVLNGSILKPVGEAYATTDSLPSE